MIANAPSGGPTSGTVTVADTLPSGLTLVSMTGPGWTCSGATCTRGDSLIAGATYSPISLVVNVAYNAGGSLISEVTVSGGGAATVSTAFMTTVKPAAADLVWSSSTIQFQSALNGSALSQQVSVTNLFPASVGLTLSSATQSGGNWLSATGTATTPATVTISVSPSGLVAGTYQGQVTATAASGGSASLAISLLVGVPTINTGGVVNGASFSGSALSPGSISSLFGTQLSATQMAAASVPLPTQLGGTQVSVNGAPAPLFYVSASQINFQMLAGLSTATIAVQSGGGTSASVALALSAAAPGIFTTSSSGSGQGTILNQDFSSNSVANPAAAGSFVMIYCTGLGAVNPSLAAGLPGATAPPYNLTVVNPVVTVGGQGGSVQFSAAAPGFVGLYQINVQLPAGVTGSAVPVTVSAAGSTSNAVTIAIK